MSPCIHKLKNVHLKVLRIINLRSNYLFSLHSSTFSSTICIMAPNSTGSRMSKAEAGAMGGRQRADNRRHAIEAQASGGNEPGLFDLIAVHLYYLSLYAYQQKRHHVICIGQDNGCTIYI